MLRDKTIDQGAKANDGQDHLNEHWENKKKRSHISGLFGGDNHGEGLLIAPSRGIDNARQSN